MFSYYVRLLCFFWRFTYLNFILVLKFHLSSIGSLGVKFLVICKVGYVPLLKLAFHYFPRTKNRNIMKHGTCFKTHWNNSFQMLTARFLMSSMFFLFVVLHFLFFWWKWAIFAPKTNHQQRFQQAPIDYELLRTHIIQHIDRRKRLAPLLVVFLFSLDIRH